MGMLFYDRTYGVADGKEQVYGNSCISSDIRRLSWLKCSCYRRRSVPFPKNVNWADAVDHALWLSSGDALHVSILACLLDTW